MRRLGSGCAMAFVLVLSATTAGASAKAADRDASSAFPDATFSDPTTIDNEWDPLAPGTQMTLEGRSNRGEGQRPHRLVITTTDLTKVVAGVTALVVVEQDYNDGKISEEELAFHAQADDGTVWNLGQYPEEYEDGTFVGAPHTWIAGLAGARPGVTMPADPRVGAVVVPWVSSYLVTAGALALQDGKFAFTPGENARPPFVLQDGKLVPRPFKDGRLELDPSEVRAVRLEQPVSVDPNGYLVEVGVHPRDRLLEVSMWLLVLVVVGWNLLSLAVWWRARRAA